MSRSSLKIPEAKALSGYIYWIQTCIKWLSSGKIYHLTFAWFSRNVYNGMRNNKRRLHVIRMDNNRNDIGSRNYLASLSGISLLSFCRRGMSRCFISEIKKQLEGNVLFPSCWSIRSGDCAGWPRDSTGVVDLPSFLESGDSLKCISSKCIWTILSITWNVSPTCRNVPRMLMSIIVTRKSQDTLTMKYAVPWSGSNGSWYCPWFSKALDEEPEIYVSCEGQK
jgi:hypothetical protein